MSPTCVSARPPSRRRVSCAQRLVELRELSAQRERELDLIVYELGEIDEVSPDEGEYERLRAARERLRRLDALCGAAGLGVEALAPDAGVREHNSQPAGTQLLAAAVAQMDALAGLDPTLDALAERMHALIDRGRRSRCRPARLPRRCRRARTGQLAARRRRGDAGRHRTAPERHRAPDAQARRLDPDGARARQPLTRPPPGTGRRRGRAHTGHRAARPGRSQPRPTRGRAQDRTRRTPRRGSPGRSASSWPRWP